MTYEAYADHALAATIILTHRTFTDSLTFLSLIIARFTLRAPAHLTGPALQKWAEQVQTPVRIRVSNVLRQWIALSPEDFNAADLSAALISFVDGPMQGSTPTMAAHLRAFFQKRHDRARDPQQPQTPQPGRAPPKALLSRKLFSGGPVELADIKPLEVARQLCLIDQAIFCAIRPTECIGRLWLKANPKTLAPNVVAMTDRFNALSAYVRTSIVQVPKQKPRAELIKRWVKVAYHLRLLNNFHSLLAVLSGLESAAVHRLRATWPHVSRKALSRLADLRQALNARGGHRVLRDMVRTADPPLLPYLGIALGDLVAVEESQSDMLEGLINVRKRRLLGDVVRELQRHQATRYCFVDVPAVREFLFDLSSRIVDEDACYRLSCQIEPRDRREPVSRSSNLQRLIASNPALSAVATEPKVSMRRSTQPDKTAVNAALNSPTAVTEPAANTQSSGALTPLEIAVQGVNSPAAALALAKEWCHFEKGNEAWRTLLTSRALPFLLLASAHIDILLPTTLITEFYTASLLLSDTPSRLLTELASTLRGRPRDDDITTALTPFLAAFCAAPLQPEQRAQVEQLANEIERAQNSERATLEATSFPSDEVRHLAALRAHLEAAAAAVASEQAMYDTLVTLCATTGPPARFYARATDTLHTPALRLLHERVVGGGSATPLDTSRSATYWAALAFAGAAESALQALYAKEESDFQDQCRAALRRILNLLEAHVATLVGLVRTLQLRLLSRRGCAGEENQKDLSREEQEDAAGLAMLLPRVDEAEEVATEVLDGLTQLAASAAEKATRVFSDLVQLRALERALEEELPMLFAEDPIAAAELQQQQQALTQSQAQTQLTSSSASLPLSASSILLLNPSPSAGPSPISASPSPSFTFAQPPASLASSDKTLYSSTSSTVSTSSTSSTHSSSSLVVSSAPLSLPPPSQPPLPLPSPFSSSNISHVSREPPGSPPAAASITSPRDTPTSPRAVQRTRTVARRPHVDQLLQQIDTFLASTTPSSESNSQP